MVLPQFFRDACTILFYGVEKETGLNYDKIQEIATKEQP
jgi:hypothetical protein